MKKRTILLASVFVILALVVSGCSAASLPYVGSLLGTSTPTQSTASAASTTQSASSSTFTPGPTPPTPSTAPVVNPSSSSGSSVTDLQNMLEQVYAAVNPSVVSISDIMQGGQALGSGFVWDTNGDIVTNNHVISGATNIEVTFSDGTTVPATLVAADPNSDLAVVRVSVAASMLHPISIADSSQLKVGQIAIAIGNPFGFSNTMTYGIVSALARALPTNTSGTGSSYVIPDIIQTDAPINPGNSGGVLLDYTGRLIGVTSAIESQTNQSSGIGFAIPSNIVAKVIPALISTGKYQHPYLGISGTDMTPDIAKAMNLPSTQLGALVVTVTSGGPSAQAGLQASNQQATINGQAVPVGGDVIIAINGQAIKTFDDVAAYLEENTQVGQTVTLTILRNGQQMQVKVTLGARPSSTGSSTGQTTTPAGAAYLGISGITVTSAIDQAMNLPAGVTGVLIEQVQAGSPASDAGLVGGSQTATIGAQKVTLGGDVIIGVDGVPITSTDDLSAYLQQVNPGDQGLFTIIHNGNEVNVTVTLGSAPSGE